MPGKSSIREADPPVITRIRVVLSRLTDYVQSGGADSKYSRFAWIMQSMSDEVLDELADAGSEQIGQWFAEFGKIIEWCGTGDDSILPDSVRPYLRQQVTERLALTAGSSD